VKVKGNPGIEGLGDSVTAFEAMMLSLISKAMKGDVKAAREILDRLEGKSVQKIQDNTKVAMIDKLSELSTEDLKKLAGEK